MSLRVLFGGATLVKPGAASQVQVNAKTARLTGVGILGVIGEADSGQPHTLLEFTDPASMRAFFRSGPLADSAAICFNPANDPRITGAPLKVVAYLVNNTTQSASNLKNVTPANLIDLKSKEYGVHTNKISITVAADIVTIELIDGNTSVKEISPALGQIAKFQMQYTGVGTVATVTISDTQLTTAVTGGPGGETLTINFSEIKTIEELVKFIDAHAAYTATLVSGSNPLFPSNQLDRITTVDVKTANLSIFAKTQDFIDWINQNSTLITSTRTSAALTGTPQALAKTFFTGGTIGTSANADWQTAFDQMGTTRINQIVPLASKNGTASGVDGYGIPGTYTIASVLAAMDSYAATQSAVAGRNEVQAYGSMDDTKTAVKSQLATLNSLHSLLSFQKIKLPDAANNMKNFSAWSSALAAAAMRSSAPLGEPLTFKFVRGFGITQDTSFTLPGDIADLLLAGAFIIENVPGKGLRVVKGNTTYTKQDIDAFTEESVVVGWKTMSFDLRTQLEAAFVGSKGIPANVAGIKSLAESIFSAFKKAEVITDSTDDAGNPLNAWRNVTVTLSGDTATLTAEVTMVQGINFILITSFLVPVRLAA